ncbi:MAG: TRAP transporter substrate-binding protein [Janthinobacterium lividum]
MSQWQLPQRQSCSIWAGIAAGRTMLMAVTMVLSGLLFCGGAIGASPALALALPSEISIATAYAADNFQTQNLQMFADDVRRATNGKVNFKLYPAGSLLKPADIFSGVRAGRAGAGEMMMSSLTHEAVIFGLDALPFIVSDYDDARRMWKASRPAVAEALHAKDLELLYAVPWPGQNLYATREIKSVIDFRGLRMRTYNQSTERIAELVGASKVSFQVIELARAIEQEKLDLMLTSSWTGVDTKAWSRMHYYYKVNAWIPKNMVFIDAKLFAGLDAATKAIVREAAEVAERRGWKMSQESDRRYESQLAANHVNVSTLDFFLRSYLDRMGENLARDWLRKAGPDELNVLLKYTTERSMK